ncbi:uncharacterized protein CCOS01_08205 [Colletotrichum costaricense]|uniref:Uncharacterized protein n=1 Tax=Colletotrichum costaricense TaxID=1209916 RepID=A0AAI9YVE3_9PEZI|nr:uncharacterized protein CCOS01_08205 [Colletotrichum costaricense]KAK1525787.1 hypothetical protein CCOS01_08205 [Colletotrichum costaricense]
MSSAQGNNELPLPPQDGGVSSHSQQRPEWETHQELMKERPIVIECSVFDHRYKHLDTIQLGDVLNRSEEPDDQARWRRALGQAVYGYLEPTTEDNDPRLGYSTTMNNAFHTLRIDGRNFYHLVTVLTWVEGKDWIKFPKRIFVEYGSSTVPIPGGTIWQDKTEIVRNLFKKEFFFDSDDFTPNNGKFLEYADENEEITRRRNCILIFLLLQVFPNVEEFALDKRIAAWFYTDKSTIEVFREASNFKPENKRPIKKLSSLSLRGMDDDQQIAWQGVCWLSTIMPSKHLFLEGKFIFSESSLITPGLMGVSDITLHKVQLGKTQIRKLIDVENDKISAFRYIGEDVDSENSTWHDPVDKVVSNLQVPQSQFLKTLCIGLCEPPQGYNVKSSPVNSLKKLTSLTHLWINSGKTSRWNDGNLRTFTKELPPSLNHLRITGNVQDVESWINFVQKYPYSVFSNPRKSKLGVSKENSDLVQSMSVELIPRLYIIKDHSKPLFNDPFVAQNSGGTEVLEDEMEPDILLWRINDDTEAQL